MNPTVVHAPLPRYPRPDHRVSWVVDASVGLLLGVLLCWVAEGPNWIRVSSGAAALFLVMPAVWSVEALFFTARRRRRLWWACDPKRGVNVACEAAVARLAKAAHDLESRRRSVFRPLDSLWSWQEFIAMCEQIGLPRPYTVVDTDLTPRLASIDRPVDMLERESIVDTAGASRVGVWIAFAFGVVLVELLFRSQSRILWCSLVLLAIAFAIVATPAIRSRFRRWNPKDAAVIAGLDGVSDARGRIWTVENAVMVVQTTDDGKRVIVRLIGEAGELTLSYADETDPDFIALWQRWNHPTPRPELLQDDVGFNETRSSL